MTTTHTRRTVLASAAALGAATAVGPLGQISTASAATGHTARGRLVVVFLRGGADHLSITVPLDEATYHDRRPTIAVEPSVALPLDDQFGFHPAMPRLHGRYLDGDLAPVVAIGNPAADRSHFLAQDLLERGSDGVDGLGDGWLARHLAGTAAPDDSALRAITVGANVDDSLIGYPALGMLTLRSFGLAGAGAEADAFADTLRRAHGGDGPVERVAEQALHAANVVAQLPSSTTRNPVAAAFEDVVTLLDADLGTEVITLNVNGWDTHDRMGTSADGQMRRLLTDLDGMVGGMSDALDERGIGDVTTLVVTEFGRRVAENGSGGCDHGWGSVGFVLGAAAAGGRVHGDWPGLAPDVVDDARGDVPMTTDYRDVLGEIVHRVLDGDPQAVFPDHDLAPLGIIE